MSKHTPGPWRIENDAPSYCINAGERRHVAMVSCYTDGTPGNSSSENLANARLIAAAPDLLAAAKLALDDCCDLIQTGAGNALEAAIAKAEGK